MCVVAATAADECFQGHQRCGAVQMMAAALRFQLPETAIVPFGHHSFITASIGAITTLLRLPIVESRDILVIGKRGNKVFQESSLAGR